MTHLSRPRLWLAVLLAALSLMVFVTLEVRRSDAQEELLRTVKSKPSPGSTTESEDLKPASTPPASDPHASPKAGAKGGSSPTTAGSFGVPGSPFGGGMGADGPPSVPRSTIMLQDDVVVLPKEVIESGQYVVQGHVAIGWSKNNDMLFGYCERLGKWVKQPVTIPVKQLIPVVIESVVSVKSVYNTKPDKKSYFAFSPAIGRWETIEVSAAASDPLVYGELVVLTDGETTHVFKNATGKWSTPTASIADNVVPMVPGRSPNIGTPILRHSYEPPVLIYSDGQGVYLFDLDADGTLDVVPVDGMKSSIPDENLPNDNHSVVEAWRRFREAVGERREALAERATLQETLGPKHPAIVRLNERLAELAEEEQDWNTRLKAFAPSASFGRVTVIDWQSRLKSELQKAERDADQAARAVKSPTYAGTKEQAQVRLRESVGKAFAARQTLQRLEAELLRDRLRQVDVRLQDRDRLRDRIIQRRVEELTNSNLDWGASEPATDGSVLSTDIPPDKK